MTLTQIVALLGTGVVAGFASGLLGVGSGFIVVPVQYWIYTAMGIPIDIAVLLAFGTNLMVILPTAASGAWRHSRKKAVWWRAGIILGICGMIGAFGGATIASHLPGATLKIAFGAVILASGIRMLTAKLPRIEEVPKDNHWLWVALGIPIGLVVGILGIGGGILMVPAMTLILKFKMHNAVATSTAVMMFSSLGGLVGYIINGLGVSGLPSHSIGYINLPVWFLLAVTSVGMAQVGAMTAHRLPARQLRWIFIAVMLYIGLKMIGVFGWLGWPI
jgi:hypothetical protein